MKFSDNLFFILVFSVLTCCPKVFACDIYDAVVCINSKANSAAQAIKINQDFKTAADGQGAEVSVFGNSTSSSGPTQSDQNNNQEDKPGADKGSQNDNNSNSEQAKQASNEQTNGSPSSGGGSNTGSNLGSNTSSNQGSGFKTYEGYKAKTDLPSINSDFQKLSSEAIQDKAAAIAAADAASGFGSSSTKNGAAASSSSGSISGGQGAFSFGNSGTGGTLGTKALATVASNSTSRSPEGSEFGGGSFGGGSGYSSRPISNFGSSNFKSSKLASKNSERSPSSLSPINSLYDNAGKRVPASYHKIGLSLPNVNIFDSASRGYLVWQQHHVHFESVSTPLSINKNQFGNADDDL